MPGIILVGFVPPVSKADKCEHSEENMLVYKVVEVSTVSDECLEKTLNEWTRLGWRLDGMQFAMRESSRRPSMAYVIFTREEDE